MPKIARKRNFPHKNLESEKPNPNYVDVLEEDKPLSGQAYGCFSFISPEKILKKKEIFFFEQFLKNWELTKSMEKFSQFINFISYKYKISSDAITKDLNDFVEEEKELIRKPSSIEDDYKIFLDKNEEALQKRFDIENNFQTNVRAFKARGNFATLEEAKFRGQCLHESDPMFSVMVGPIGTWLVLDPDEDKTGDVIYAEEELNQLAHEKKKNEEKAKKVFDERIKEAKKQAIRENVEKARKNQITLTQTIDENNNLINLANTNTQEIGFLKNNKEPVTTAEIQKELFEGDNIVMPTKLTNK